MRKKFRSFLIAAVLIIMLAGCAGEADQEETTDTGEAQLQQQETIENTKSAEDSQVRTMVIQTGGQFFQAELYDNETARAFAAMLPITLDMDEMNGNEKYYFLDQSLPQEADFVGNIENGDIMLYGSDCLVLFFKDFSTSYSYTKIGKIQDISGFEEALGSGTSEVSFRME